MYCQLQFPPMETSILINHTHKLKGKVARLPYWPSEMFVMTYGFGNSHATRAAIFVNIMIPFLATYLDHNGCLSSLHCKSQRLYQLVCVHALECVNMWNIISVVVKETHIKNAPQHIVMLIHSDIKDLAFPLYLSPGTRQLNQTDR